MTVRIVHWDDQGMELGYLEDYPDYMTQGADYDELRENLLDIYRDITEGLVPGARKVDTLEINA